MDNLKFYELAATLLQGNIQLDHDPEYSANKVAALANALKRAYIEKTAETKQP